MGVGDGVGDRAGVGVGVAVTSTLLSHDIPEASNPSTTMVTTRIAKALFIIHPYCEPV